MKKKSVTITPIPTVAETAKSLGMSKKRVKKIMEIMGSSKEDIEKVLEEM